MIKVLEWNPLLRYISENRITSSGKADVEVVFDKERFKKIQ
jgi:hypothetical protein